jgi:hypothetical protein
MADYKGIQGFAIQNLTSDPTADEGQVWYNSTTNIFKETAATTAGTWASATSMNTARHGLAGAGIQTAALAFGGTPPVTAATEEYDGSTWTSNPTGLNTARRYLAGCGTQTAALAFGGYDTVNTGATEEYDGSTWTSNPTGLNTARLEFSRLWNSNCSFSFWWSTTSFRGN